MAENNLTLAEQLAELNAAFAFGLNTSWLLLTGIGIVTMQAGFLALEVGATRAKNVKATLFKNTIDHALGSVAWYCVGWSLFTGNNPFVSGNDVTWFNHYETEFARIFQQYGFAVTASTIVSGALLSRCRLRVYAFFSFLLGLYVYPFAAHWAWVESGWLYDMGYMDFAGSGVVHMLGGACALAGAMACGPRIGRFSDGESEYSHSHSFNELNVPIAPKLRHKIVDKLCCKSKFMKKVVDVLTLNVDPGFHVREQPGHSAPMQCFGALLLYIAWFSFNSGSSGGLETIDKANAASRAAVNTMLAAASGTVSALTYCDVILGQYHLNIVINGLLSGMVAVTAPCGYCDPWAAIVVGALSAPVYIYSSKFVIYILKVDDPIDAVSVHFTNGFLGVVWTGLADLNNGLFYTGNPRLLGVQVLGGLCIGAWGFLNAALFFYGVKTFLPYLVCCLPDNEEDNVKEYSIVHSPDAQLVGLDFLYYGGSGFPEFDVEAVSEFNATQRIKERFRAKQVRTMRIFDRELPDASTHGGKHVSANFGSSSNLPTTTVDSSKHGSSHMPKRPSEQTIVIDAQTFTMDNPAMDGEKFRNDD